MKKVLLLVLALSFVCVGMASAKDGIWDKIKDNSAKVALAYNLDTNSSDEAIGGAVTQDIFGYKGIDHDLFITGELSEGTSNDEKNLMTGLSYNYYFGKDESWSAFVGAGVTGKNIFDIQQIRDENNLEVDKYVYVGLGKKFN